MDKAYGSQENKIFAMKKLVFVVPPRKNAKIIGTTILIFILSETKLKDYLIG